MNTALNADFYSLGGVRDRGDGAIEIKGPLVEDERPLKTRCRNDFAAANAPLFRCGQCVLHPAIEQRLVRFDPAVNVGVDIRF